MSKVTMFVLLLMAVQMMATMMEQPSESVVYVRAAAAFAEMAFVHHSVDHYVLKMKPHLMEYYLSDVLSDVGKKL